MTFLLLLYFWAATYQVMSFSLKYCRCSNLKVICDKRGLTSVPHDIPPTAVILDISTNDIHNVSNADFKNLPNLQMLDFSYNQVSHIPDGTFANLKNLDELNLGKNSLQSLSDGYFQGLNNLSLLKLYRNSIERIAPSTFQYLYNLKVLDLTGNKLYSVQQIQLQDIPHLKDLYIKGNLITVFQSHELSNKSVGLKTFDISYNPLKLFLINNDIFHNLSVFKFGGPKKSGMAFDVKKQFLSRVMMADLSDIHMSVIEFGMVLQSLSSSLKHLKLNKINGPSRSTSEFIDLACHISTLTSLQIQRNQIKVVSEKQLKYCSQIIELDLSMNQITELSSNISLPNIQNLNLAQNKFSSVPVAIQNFLTLKNLDLNHNHILKLTCSEFENLTEIVTLSLSNNHISKINGCVFKDMKNLRTLSISNNRIKQLGNAFQGNLQNLQTLNCTYNQLSTIKKGEFAGLLSLENLHLYANQITLKPGAFEGLANLKTMVLSKNNIDSLQIRGDVFGNLRNLTSLNLIENHIKYTSDAAIDPPFANLTSLETLLIFSQHRRLRAYLPRNFLQGLTNLKTFRARAMQLTSLHRDMFVYTPQLKTLEISSNDLYYLAPEMFHPIPRLESLYASRVGLQSLDFFIKAKLNQLKFLQVRKNAFSVISESVINSLPALVYLDMKGDGYTCDCINAGFIKWVKSSNQTQVVDAHDFVCNYPAPLRNTSLWKFDIRDCLVEVNFYCYVTTTTMTLLFLLGSFTYRFLKWQLVYTYYLLLALLFDNKKRNKRASYQYDAFVSYNIHDEPWVVGELLPKLEEEQGWKMCLHHRDFQPGKPIVDNITDAIYGSRKTVCVISRHYLQSEWCSRELQVASFRLFDERKDVLILVFLEEIPSRQLSPYHHMGRLLKRRTYLSWPRAGQHTGLFWEKLRLALETGEDSAEDHPILTRVEEQ